MDTYVAQHLQPGTTMRLTCRLTIGGAPADTIRMAFKATAEGRVDSFFDWGMKGAHSSFHASGELHHKAGQGSSREVHTESWNHANPPESFLDLFKLLWPTGRAARLQICSCPDWQRFAKMDGHRVVVSLDEVFAAVKPAKSISWQAVQREAREARTIFFLFDSRSNALVGMPSENGTAGFPFAGGKSKYSIAKTNIYTEGLGKMFSTIAVAESETGLSFRQQQLDRAGDRLIEASKSFDDLASALRNRIL